MYAYKNNKSGNVKIIIQIILLRVKTANKKRRMLSDTVELEILKQLGASTEAKKEEDGDTLFGKSIAATLRSLDPRKKHLRK